ncbi:MAG: hypothetical protein OXU23_16665 [Candidatus Poribacteria bacterium]|nr:hypothetical protein [Candidatus Poribacteria bacterium]
MDTIEDTEEALESFLKLDIDSSDEGRNYLRIYGALQALFVQQDAVKNLHDALKIPYTEDKALDKIRNIRNDAAGHPTKRGNKRAFNFISRPTVSSHGFQLITYYRTNSGNDKLDSKREDINVPDLIATQKSVFVDVLNNIIKALQEEEMEHKKRFAGKKLTDAFRHTSHLFQKVLEATISPDSPHVELVGVHIDQILKSVEAFKTELKERDEPDDNFAYRYENLDYALRNIKTYFHTPQGTHIHREDTYILADFAQRQVEILEEIAQEIDERYSDV